MGQLNLKPIERVKNDFDERFSGIMCHFDNFMRKKKGQAWIDEKNERAITKYP